ncbi:MAG: hypothetical protein CMI17_07570 [Opitutaceae bacterium]|nr:hypothetical protein [Opitutaceae bacterium]
MGDNPHDDSTSCLAPFRGGQLRYGFPISSYRNISRPSEPAKQRCPEPTTNRAIQRYEQAYEISQRPIPWAPSRNLALCNRLHCRGLNSSGRSCQGSEGRAKAVMKVPALMISDKSDKDTATDARKLFLTILGFKRSSFQLVPIPTSTAIPLHDLPLMSLSYRGVSWHLNEDTENNMRQESLFLKGLGRGFMN